MLDYSKILSPTVTSLKKSGIRKFFDLLEEMDNVVSLTVGQPDFVTPWHIREAGKALSAERPITRQMRARLSCAARYPHIFRVGSA